MKKINSNGYAGKVLLTCGANLATGALLRHIPYVPLFVSATVTFIGAVILTGFILLLFIESRQDHRINKQHTAIRTTKIRLPGGLYECQACGNNRVQEAHDACPICGNRFT